MPLFKSKNGKLSKSQSVKKAENKTTEDIQQNNNTNNDNNSLEVKIIHLDNEVQESMVEEPKDLSSYEGNINLNVPGKKIVNDVHSVTSLDTNASKNTDKTHGTVTFNSNSSVNDNEDDTTERVPNVPKLNSTHKRNSIFRSFSKMRRKSKNSDDKKYKSAPHLESEDSKSPVSKSKSPVSKTKSPIFKSNSVKSPAKNKLDDTNSIDNIKMKRYKSVPDTKTHLKSSKKKKRNDSLNIDVNNKDIRPGPVTASCDFPVKETNTMVRDYDPKTGRKMINNYVVVKEVGRGCHGKVKLVYDSETNEQYAMKIVNKKLRRRFYYRMALSHQHDAVNPHMEKIKREIAILKKCSHPHVVRLKEVIDSPESEKIYIILEYLDGGEVKWQVSPEEPKPVMTQDVARRVFRDVISGVGYLHHQGIVHRDIKPANLLWSSDGHVKISDFGVSCFMNTDNPNLTSQERRNNELELAKTAGSPAFFAPELCGINDDEISNTITQFAALLNSRTSNKSQSAFPRTPSNISSYSKLDAIFAPRSINTPSIMSRMSDGSLNKANNDSKSIISQDDKSQTDMNDTTVINQNLPNDKSSYSSLLQPPSENIDKSETSNISEKQSTLSLTHPDLTNPPQKPRSIKWVQCPSKRSLSLSEGTTNINVISKSSLDDKLNLTNNIVLNKSYSVRSNRSNSSNIHYSSNESLNVRRKVTDNHNAESKTGYSSSYSTLDSNNRIRVDGDGKHYLKVHSKSNLSINLDGSNESVDNNINTSNITYNINNCTSPTEYEKTIPSESPLFVRRRCSQSSSKSNKISRSQSSLSSKFNDKKGNSSGSVLRAKGSYSSSISQLSNPEKNKEEEAEQPAETVPKRPTPHIDGKLIDIWAMGVTLYCLIFGTVPFTASTEFELLSVICHQELKFPEDIPISDSLRDLLTKILTKDPKKRIGMKEIENHPWVTEDMTKEERKEWLEFVSLNDDPLDVTEDEVKKALTLRERIKKGFSKFTHSLNFIGEFRRRTKSMPSVKGLYIFIKTNSKLVMTIS